MKCYLLLSSTQEEISRVRDLKKLSIEVFCCVSEQSDGVACSRLLPKEITRKLGGDARLFAQYSHQYIRVQWIKRFELIWRWRWAGKAYTLWLLCSLEEKHVLVMSYHEIGKTSTQIPKKTWRWQRGFAGSKRTEAFADMNQLGNVGDSCLPNVQQCVLYSALVPVVLG